MHRTLASLVLALALLVSGCGGATEDSSATPDSTPTSAEPTESPSESGSPSESPSEEPEPEPAGLELAVTVRGGDVRPNAEQVELPAGEPLVITFDSDRAGELHVHSSPEQLLEFDEGRSRQRITVDSPGLVEVEEHESGVVVAVLRVR